LVEQKFKKVGYFGISIHYVKTVFERKNDPGQGEIRVKKYWVFKINGQKVGKKVDYQ
jgi:hypothetical protein